MNAAKNDGQLVAVGCLDCDETCPYTDETTPRLTRALADAWYEVHLLVCPRR